jgi:hypothetical protein
MSETDKGWRDKAEQTMAEKLIDLGPEDAIEDLPRCTHPVGSEHDWLPATAGVVRCGKCSIAVTTRIW